MTTRGARLITLSVVLLLAGCGSRRTTDAEKILDATDPISDCAFVEEVCDVNLRQGGKELTITFPDGSHLNIFATYRTADRDYIDNCFDDVAISDGEWIYAATKTGDVDLAIPLQSCDE